VESAVGSSHGAIAYEEGVSIAELGYVFFGRKDWNVGRRYEVVAHPIVLGGVRGEEGFGDWVEWTMIIILKMICFGATSRNSSFCWKSEQHFFIFEQDEEGDAKCQWDALPG